MTELEKLLENKKFQGITGLFRWSSNYDAPTPYTYFLDLIGYSRLEFGMELADWNKVTKVFKFVELDYLADALKEYAHYGPDAHNFITDLIEAQSKVELRKGRW